MTKMAMAKEIVAVWRSHGSIKGVAEDTMIYALVDTKNYIELSALHSETCGEAVSQ